MFFKKKKHKEEKEKVNVIDCAQNINLLEIIVSSNLKQEIEKIRNLYKDTSIKIISLADFEERNMMRDAR